MNELIRKLYTAKIRDIDLEKRRMTMAISTEVKDRDGDIIEVAGWDLKAYKKNPVVMFAHRYGDPAVGKSVRVWTEGKKLMSRTEFAPTPLGMELWALYSQGYMHATSVGFIPHEWEPMEAQEGEEQFFPGKRYKKQELLEYSLVPVPSNPQALSLAIEKGLKMDEVKKAMEIEEKPEPNEHACRLKPPGQYDRFARKNCEQKHDGKCIDVIYGIKEGKSEIQSLRYKKDVWAAPAARSHCKGRGGSFEAAGGESATADADTIVQMVYDSHEHPSSELLEEVRHISQAKLGDDLDYLVTLLRQGQTVEEKLKPLAKELCELLSAYIGDDTAVDIKEGAALSRESSEALQGAKALIEQVLERAEPQGEAREEGLDMGALAEAIALRLANKE